MKLRSQNKKTHIFCVFNVYDHFVMLIFGRHTKTWSWECHECIGSPLGPDTQEISHVFHIQTENQENNNRNRIPHLLVTIFKIPNSLVHLELRIVVGILSESLKGLPVSIMQQLLDCCVVLYFLLV